MASIKKGPIACSVCHTFNLPSATHCRTCNHDLQIRGTNKDLRGYLKSFWTSESLLVLSGLSLLFVTIVPAARFFGLGLLFLIGIVLFADLKLRPIPRRPLPGKNSPPAPTSLGKTILWFVLGTVICVGVIGLGIFIFVLTCIATAKW